jgi:hypothetical protein
MGRTSAKWGVPSHRHRVPRHARVRRGPRALRRVRAGRAEGASAARPDLRVAVPKPASKPMRTIDRVGDVVDVVTGEMGVEDGFVPPRYGWPPRSATSSTRAGPSAARACGCGVDATRCSSDRAGPARRRHGRRRARHRPARLRCGVGAAAHPRPRHRRRARRPAGRGRRVRRVGRARDGLAQLGLALERARDARRGDRVRARTPRRQPSAYPRQPQGTSVATDHYETIGAATLGAGRNLVSCRHIPFGRVTRRERLRREHGFVVERGSRTTGWAGGAPVRRRSRARERSEHDQSVMSARLTENVGTG